ncbi:MAG: adenylate/guanylate cyclase domain-containing protein [Proteobacteria bacterium]|nr:adenylate/guanylate cyclase domain-containing protein [Pseudomonadota bacterium]
MKKIGILMVLGNLLGAWATFFYFKFVLPSTENNPIIPGYYDILSFLAGMAILIVLGFLLFKRKSTQTLFAVADGRQDISEFDSSMVSHLQRGALQYPMVVTVISFFVWNLAGFMFGFLEPLLQAKIFNLATPDLVLCLRQFLGIILLGGGITCMVLFFVLENAWRSYIPRFFPEGHLNRVQHVFKISVRKRFLVVTLGIILIPLPIIVTTVVANIRQLHLADELTRSHLITSLYWELLFISTDLLAIALVLAYFLSKSILTPLLGIKNAIKAVANNDLDTRVAIVSNDELGDVAQGINAMIISLNESRRVKDSFGRYLGREIGEEILSGKTDMEGEMKRVTLLFSDLRNFTGLVEKNHPRQVVKILNQYFNEMTLAVKAHKGLILQYVGDEIEAVFGAPVGFDDHPEMAVRAALEMRKRLLELNVTLEGQGVEPLGHGIGIHSGAVLAGNIGSQERMSYALVGDTVNTASRIEGLTKVYDTDIILSQTTHNLLIGSYATKQLAPVRVKGKDDDLIVYTLLS